MRRRRNATYHRYVGAPVQLVPVALLALLEAGRLQLGPRPEPGQRDQRDPAEAGRLQLPLEAGRLQLVPKHRILVVHRYGSIQTIR